MIREQLAKELDQKKEVARFRQNLTVARLNLVKKPVRR